LVTTNGVLATATPEEPVVVDTTTWFVFAGGFTVSSVPEPPVGIPPVPVLVKLLEPTLHPLGVPVDS
jgi:hypothetical protein